MKNSMKKYILQALVFLSLGLSSLSASAQNPDVDCSLLNSVQQSYVNLSSGYNVSYAFQQSYGKNKDTFGSCHNWSRMCATACDRSNISDCPTFCQKPPGYEQPPRHEQPQEPIHSGGNCSLMNSVQQSYLNLKSGYNVSYAFQQSYGKNKDTFGTCPNWTPMCIAVCDSANVSDCSTFCQRTGAATDCSLLNSVQQRYINLSSGYNVSYAFQQSYGQNKTVFGSCGNWTSMCVNSCQRSNISDCATFCQNSY